MVKHEELITNAQTQADKSLSNHSADKYISQATVYLIESNLLVEKAINEFSRDSQKQALSNQRLAKSQVIFAIAQVVLAAAAIIISIIALSRP
jgi:hypothetical protein